MQELNHDDLKEAIIDDLKRLYRKDIEEASEQEIYQALSYALKDYVIDLWMDMHKTCQSNDARIVYYLSMEFLMGRTLGNMILNLQANPVVHSVLKELGLDLANLEEQEPDPALGNGGLGRLAACFLDSLATMNYPACGCGIRYKYGLFKQKIKDGYQIEEPDNWTRNGYPFEMKRPEYAVEVKFGGYVKILSNGDGRDHFELAEYVSVMAIPYDLPIVGYGNRVVNTLRIWDAEAMNTFDLESFDKGNYQRAVEQQNLARTICEVLYPNDNHIAGKELRLKQQYFFVSASVQRAILKYLAYHEDILKLPEKVCFQMNDTHPTLVIAELMRILLDEYYLLWDDAWAIVQKCCAYTNHTIMSEALEKWPIDLFSRLLPRVYQVVEEMNRRFVNQIRAKYPGNEDKVKSMAILYDGQVRMANLAIYGGFSVNGVARLHTEILKKRELKDFYEMMPEKFSNKTNGITQRRFLLHGNPRLAQWVTDKIGDGWITDLSQMKKLLPYIEDAAMRQQFMEIKYQNKVELAKYIKEHNNIEVDPNSIFDVQVKRLHEYKRQMLNILHVMHLYNQLKVNPNMDFYPRTFIFGAKASAGYQRAKAIIKLINSVADVVNQDPTIYGKIKVVFIENYRVSNAEKIFAAADVSEQISTASKEASGTGNMKFMLNGAITIGTLDGANVEILEEVGAENAFIFGMTSEEVMRYEREGGYNPREIYNNDGYLRRVINQLIDGSYAPQNPNQFRELYDSLLNNNGHADEYFILKDFHSYEEAQKQLGERYKDKEAWARSAMRNTACSGKFSSDRTVEEYVRDIWKLEKISP